MNVSQVTKHGKKRNASNKIRKSRSERFYIGFCVIICTLFAVICFYPMLYTFIISITPGKIYDEKAGIILWFPAKWSWVGYRQMLTGQTYVFTALKITVFRTVIASILHVLVCSLTGYALSRKGLPGKKTFMLFMLVTMLFGAGLIPGYLNIQELGLLNSFWVMILPGMFSAFDSLIFKQFFEGIPDEIEEAATMDGVSELQLFGMIILPLSKSVIAAIGLFTVIGNWTAWFDAYLYISPAHSDLWPLQTFVMLTFNNLSAASNSSVMDMLAEVNKAGLGVTEMATKMALTIMSMVPILIMYPFFQK